MRRPIVKPGAPYSNSVPQHSVVRDCEIVGCVQINAVVIVIQEGVIADCVETAVQEVHAYVILGDRIIADVWAREFNRQSVPVVRDCIVRYVTFSRTEDEDAISIIRGCVVGDRRVIGLEKIDASGRLGWLGSIERGDVVLDHAIAGV